MNKILSILVLAVLFSQAFNVDVRAAPPLQTIDLTAVNITPNPGDMVIDITAPDHSSDLITYQVTGQGTTKVNALADITTMCPNEEDEDTTSTCPSAYANIYVQNQDTENDRKLYACTYITQDDDTWVTSGRFHQHNPQVSNGFGYYFPLPYAKCQTYTMTANITLGLVGVDILGGVGTEGELRTWHVRMALSWSPIETCDEPFTTLTTDTFTMNVGVEDPVAQSAPDQVYTVVPGQYYKVFTSGTYYSHDYQNSFTDNEVQFSWDNENWHSFEHYSNQCFQSEEDSTGWYVQAESDTFYIRVGDGLPDIAAGEYPGYAADDHVDTDTEFLYTIEWGVIPEQAPCESQYIYDSYSDSVGFVGVPSTNLFGTLANNADIPLVVGDWYVVHWNYDYWQDSGGPQQTALEYSWTSGSGFLPLSGGGFGGPSGSVWCTSSDGLSVLIQASATNLYLRVHDQIGTFADNTGTPYYDLYHATFIRTPENCETAYKVGALIETGSVQANQSGGVGFASMSKNSLGTQWGNVSPGGWYVLDTTGGPWHDNAFPNPLDRRDMSVSVDNGATWEPLPGWMYPVCSFATDAIGHIRIVFQMPFETTAFWKFRVNDENIWFDNSGSMSWNLYGAINLASDPLPGNGQCDYSWDEGSPVVLGSVDGNDADGVPLTGMVADQIYVLKILGGVDGWYDSPLSTTAKWDMQLTTNSVANWHALPDPSSPSTIGQLCSHVTGDDLYVFLRPGVNYSYALRVASDSFDNNHGSVQYVVYPAQTGQTIENTCFQGLSLQSINEFDWIDVRSEEGEQLVADTARYTEFVSLTPGKSYAVETPVGQGPWNDGTTDKWDVALSKDNGVTWVPVSMSNTDIIDCASQNIIDHTMTAKFTVTEGDVWKIRVNDTDGAFADNTGNMAYKFYVLCDGMACTGSVPNDAVGPGSIPAVSVSGQGGGDVCNIGVIRPGPLSVSELLSVGNYFGAWVQYINLSVLRYMAWCPKHTNTFLSFLIKFKTKEPFASFYEELDNLNTIKSKMQAYDWGAGSGQDFSLFDVHSTSQLNTLINDHVFPSGSSVWDGGKLISFGQGTGLPDSYGSCSNALISRIPSKLKSGVCFASAYFIETSASFWVQIVLDISAFFMLLGMIKSSVQQTIYLITGVRPWTKSGANASIDKLASYMERRDRDADLSDEAILARERANGFRNSSFRR